jgi:hypothetical protein
MSKELNSRYPNVYRFIEAFQGFEKFYEENSNSGIDFTNFLLKLNIFDNFVTSVIEKMDLETGLELAKKLDSDSDFMLKAIEDKINTKNDLFFLTKNKSLVQISESSEDTSDDDSDHSSVSSIEDINSNDSESESEEENGQKELTVQTNKMIASSLVELKIRKRIRDFDTEKIEEE